jgi:hypothetical protein
MKGTGDGLPVFHLRLGYRSWSNIGVIVLLSGQDRIKRSIVSMTTEY